jgi:hypothetical protein
MNARLWWVSLGIILLVGCGKSGTPTAQNDAVTTTASREGREASGADRDDSCQLLEVAEVEAVLGPLSGPPYRSNANNDQPMVRGDACRYVGRDLSSIELSVTRTGGSLLLQGMDVAEHVAHDTHMKGQLPKGTLPADSTFAGDWDDLRIIGCCRINAFLGEALVVLDYTGSRAAPLQAITLVNKALQRLDKPLAIDGRAGVEPALLRLAERKKHGTPCQLVTRAEAESIVGELTAAPVESDAECQYRYRSKNDSASEEVVHVKVEWQYGFSRFRDEATASAMVGGDAANKAAAIAADLGKAMQGGDNPLESLSSVLKQTASRADRPPQNDSAASASQVANAAIAGPWDEAAFSYPEFLAVKKDVLVRVEAGLTADIGRRFAEKAMEKL